MAERSAKHRDGVEKLTSALSLFRERRGDDGRWPEEVGTELHRAYWNAMRNTVAVPERLFTPLKAKHLRKVAISKMLDSAPGCPVFVLQFIYLCRSIKGGFRATKLVRKGPTDGSDGGDVSREEKTG